MNPDDLVIYTHRFWDYLRDTGNEVWNLHIPRYAYVGRVVSIHDDGVERVYVRWPNKDKLMAHFPDHLEVLR